MKNLTHLGYTFVERMSSWHGYTAPPLLNRGNHVVNRALNLGQRVHLKGGERSERMGGEKLVGVLVRVKVADAHAVISIRVGYDVIGTIQLTIREIGFDPLFGCPVECNYTAIGC